VSEPVGFGDFVAARSAALVRSAWLLTGDETAARDLVWAALGKTRARWARVARQDSPEDYVRRVMLSTFLTWNWRWRGAFPDARVPGRPAHQDAAAEGDIRRAVSQALRTLSPQQRAAVVLRFFDDLTEAQTADVLGCSAGTVQRQTSRALSKLHDHPQFMRSI